MKTFLVPSLKITFLTLILFGGIYPIAVSLIANVMAPNKGEGAVIEINGKVVGFEAIGQSFHSARYFNSRPSAVGYHAAATGGSNKG
ncbi:MAG: potassium-transporting ATPase subunit C, partial [Cyclobacteriaceae bacterium]|nr:potassium-transporting ATPase subunit C [Cyclobacteriaceae bacterium]